MFQGGQGEEITSVCGDSVKVSGRQVFWNWTLKDGYDLNKDKDITGLEGQESEQKYAETRTYKLSQGKAHSSVWLKYGTCIEKDEIGNWKSNGLILEGPKSEYKETVLSLTLHSLSNR